MAHTTHSGGNTSAAVASTTAAVATSGHSANHSTTKMSNATGTTSAAAGATKKVEGKVSFKVGTLKQCQDLAGSTKFSEKLCEEIISFMGLPASFKSNCGITTTCGSRRRLAEE